MIKCMVVDLVSDIGVEPMDTDAEVTDTGAAGGDYAPYKAFVYV